MAESWSLVVAAKGASDEAKYVIDFADQAKKFHDEVDKGAACDGTQLATDTAELNFEATLLAAPFKIQPPSNPEEDQYGPVTKAGNRLLKSAGIEGTKFISPNCHGRVEETTSCTALDS